MYKFKFTDSYSVTPVTTTNGISLRDNYSTSGSGSLIVRLAATYAGLKNRNNMFYLPDKVRKGVETWITPYSKPVLKHHDEKGMDPIGRIVGANYVDTSGANTLIRNSKSLSSLADSLNLDSLPTFSRLKLVDELVDSGLLDDPNYRGLGYIETIAKISDKDAVEKILDGRLYTVSSSMSTNAAICSKCKVDWALDDSCEHKPGKDGMFLIAGDFVYEELSFVNEPSITFASVLSVQNSTETIELSVNEKATNSLLPEFYSVGPEMVHSLLDPQVNLLTVQDSLQNILSVVDVAKKITAQDKLITDALSIKTFADQQMLVNVHDSLHSRWDWSYMKPVEGQYMPSHKPMPTSDEVKLHEKLHVEAKSQNLEGSLVLGPLDSTLEPGNRPKGYMEMEDSKKEEAKLKNKNTEEKVEVKNSVSSESPATVPSSVSSEVKAQDEVSEIPFTLDSVMNLMLSGSEITESMSDFLYSEMEKELDSTIIADAKLSAAQRKALPSSSFCGPGKSFPVPDKSHILAARRLLGRYKGPGDKSKILACINRKAKAMGMGSSDSVSPENSKKLLDSINLSKFTDADLQILSDSIIKALADKGQIKSACLECQKNMDAVVKLEDKLCELVDQVERLEADMKLSHSELETLEDSVVKLTREKHEMRAKLLVEKELVSGSFKTADEYTTRLLDLLTKDSKIVEELLETTTGKVDTSKIIDRLNSGLANSPTGTVENPVLAKQKVYDSKMLEQIEFEYQKLLFGKSREAAERFKLEAIKRGLIPETL